MYYCITVLLHYCIVVLLYDCSIVVWCHLLCMCYVLLYSALLHYCCCYEYSFLSFLIWLSSLALLDFVIVIVLLRTRSLIILVSVGVGVGLVVVMQSEFVWVVCVAVLRCGICQACSCASEPGSTWLIRWHIRRRRRWWQWRLWRYADSSTQYNSQWLVVCCVNDVILRYNAATCLQCCRWQGQNSL